MTLEEIMRLADDYADCRGAEDCGGNPVNTEKAREALLNAATIFLKDGK